MNSKSEIGNNSTMSGRLWKGNGYMYAVRYTAESLTWVKVPRCRIFLKRDKSTIAFHVVEQGEFGLFCGLKECL